MRDILLFLLMIVGAPALAAQVVVIDGDTLDLDGVRYRIEGIDAPEIRQNCNTLSGTWACGKAARNALVTLIDGRAVHCDPIKRDSYGRVIANCFTGKKNLGQQMVLGGYAWAFRKYSDTYVIDEAKAKSASLGIWQANTEPAWDYRANKRRSTGETANQFASGACVIKGNISGGGKIYHTPVSPWYAKTRISKHRGERWFCSEAEARAAGWRAARIVN